RRSPLEGQSVPNTAATPVGDACRTAGLRIAGREFFEGDILEVRSPVDDRVVTHAVTATSDLVNDAVSSARDACRPMEEMPGHERAKRLLAAADAIAADAGPIATMLSRETGKTIRESRIELARSEGVVRLCAEEATRI